MEQDIVTRWESRCRICHATEATTYSNDSGGPLCPQCYGNRWQKTLVAWNLRCHDCYSTTAFEHVGDGGIRRCVRCYTNHCTKSEALRPTIHTDLMCDACSSSKRQHLAELQANNNDEEDVDYLTNRVATGQEEIARKNKNWKERGEKDCCCRLMTVHCQNYMSREDRRLFYARILSSLSFV